MYEIVNSSAKATEVQAKDSKYPWQLLAIGSSFKVPVADVKLPTLLTLAYRTGKRLGRKFKVVHHPDLNIFEVARLPDPPQDNKSQPGQPVLTIKPFSQTSDNPDENTQPMPRLPWMKDQGEK